MNDFGFDNDNNSEYNSQRPQDYIRVDYNFLTTQSSTNSTDRLVRKRGHYKMYYSGSNGCRIRDAVTGAKLDYIVGSNNEQLFFKVVETNSYASSASAYNNSIAAHGKTTPLFFESPEQYEKHTFSTLDAGVKVQWHERFMKFKYGNNLAPMQQ